MEVRTAYCATCDRSVRVLVEKDVPDWPSPEGADLSRVVCLEHGETCTGSMCPVFDVPSAHMKEQLAEYRRASAGG
jgi:hypothetical protein